MVELRTIVGRALEVIATLVVIALGVKLLWASPSRLPERNKPRDQVQQPIPSAPVAISPEATEGNPDSSAVLIVFSDFQCPYCAQFSKETLPQLRTKYVQPGRIRLSFRHLPIENKHPLAVQAAAAAECAGRQHKFWQMHDSLFASPKIEAGSFRALADKLDLDLKQFDGCQSGTVIEEVRQSAAQAKAFDITGTPTFFWGTVRPESTVQVVGRMSGAVPLRRFEAELEKLLRGLGK